MTEAPKPAEALEKLVDQERFRLEKLARIRERGGHPYRNDLKPKNLAHAIKAEFESQTKEELEAHATVVSVAGRILAVRDFGKSCFLSVQDRSGTLQLYVQRSVLGDGEWDRFRDLDLGDIVFAEGKLFKTKTGELSVGVARFALLTKSLKPLPEKFHGLTDIERRYRQRYLDLMLNEKTRQTVHKRAQMVDSIRRFFLERGYTEVETPMMHPLIGGAAARPFETHHNTLDMKLYMRIAPELYLKRLLVGGLERVFEINRNFRNEGVSVQHNPEFTMIEFYEAYATYEDFMILTEELFQRLGRELCGGLEIPYQGQTISLKGPWERLTVEESILKYSKFNDRSKLRDRDALLAYTKNLGGSTKHTTGHLQMLIFDAEVEENLIQPVFITHYPVDVSPLSRKNESDPFVVDRFELFISGREMGNAFSELNDPQDQKERFLSQLEARKAGDLEACDMDEDYIIALEYGMPPAAGQGLGIDRLAMLFTDSASIRDVILFPLMRPHS